MEILYIDEARISAYSKIQTSLYNLKRNSSDEEINKIINLIPPEYLNKKRDLMMICKIFAYYARCSSISNKRNAIKLFEKIIDKIKNLLWRRSSSFFWNIFGGLFYFKLWMYEEGLISIEVIIQKLRLMETMPQIEYFLPEIKEKAPEIYEKEMKPKLRFQCTDEYINKFKQLRKKYFQFLYDSNDYNDPIYSEIETNKLRLSIKRDDVDSFQKILSNLNLSVNSKICESSIENFLINSDEMTLIDFAIHCDSIKIFKFLFLNGATISEFNISDSIIVRNYDIYHIVESKIENASSLSLKGSIMSWNSEVTEYILNNNDYSFLEDSGIDLDYDDKAIEMLGQVINSCNFQFFESIFGPFLRNNPLFVMRNLYTIISTTFDDPTGFFIVMFTKYQWFYVNYEFFDHRSLFSNAIYKDNYYAIRLFLRSRKFDINSERSNFVQPIFILCASFVERKMMKMFCEHPKMNVNENHPLLNVNAFQYGILNGNTFAVEYLFYNFDVKCDEKTYNRLFLECIRQKNIYSLEIALKCYVKKLGYNSKRWVVDKFREHASKIAGFSEDAVEVFKKVVDNVIVKKVKMPDDPSTNNPRHSKDEKKMIGARRVIVRPQVQRK